MKTNLFKALFVVLTLASVSGAQAHWNRWGNDGYRSGCSSCHRNHGCSSCYTRPACDGCYTYATND